MGNWTINAEQRLTLTLSDRAAAVIEEESESIKPKSPSDYFCRIFENYYETSPASIGRTLRHQEDQLREILGEHATAQVIKALGKQKETELLQLRNSLKGDDFEDSIRLQNKTVDILLSCEKAEGKYYNRVRLYMEAVLEDYFRLTPAQRERIYFAESFDVIESAIANRQQLKVVVGSGKVFWVHPYKLMTDKLSNAWYLVCYTRLPDEPIDSKRISTLRVAHLQSVEIKKAVASISAQEKQALNKRLQTQGVQFLTTEPCVIKVKMSPRGKEKYAGMTTMRPRCRKKVGDVWEFYCTKMQAMRYFCRMASHCQIIEPEELRQDMIRYLERGIQKQKGE